MSTTWATQTIANSIGIAARATCSTGTESAPVGSAGIALPEIVAVSVFAESTGSAFSAGSLLAYIQNPLSGAWCRRRDLDLLIVSGATAEAFYGPLPDSPKKGGATVTNGETIQTERLAYVPSGLGQPNTITIIGYTR